VIKSISFQGNESIEAIGNFPSDFILLDSPRGKYRGGNGTVFNWNDVNPHLIKKQKVILAGGLDTDNVEEAIKIIRPYMVDVSSGVETEGEKDLKKIKTFIEIAKSIPVGR
jgi:phosphoribosylanthranilate isomerase